MQIDTLALALGLAGSLASIAGLVVAWVQTVRLHKLKRVQEIDAWTSMSYLKALMRNLEGGQVKMAHQNALDLFRSLLAQAIAAEDDFNLSTISAWKKIGKLASPWQERQAMLLLNSSVLKKAGQLTELPDMTYDASENPVVNEIAGGNHSSASEQCD